MNRIPPTDSSTAERILDATVAILARDGIAGVSMRAVAREAGVAVGLANYHFDNKTALVCAALGRAGDLDMDLVDPRHSDRAAATGGCDPSEQLRISLRRAVDPTVLDPDYLTLRLQLWSLAGVDPRFGEINRSAQRRYLDGLTALIAAARPELDDGDVERRAADILIVQNGVWLTAILISDDEAVGRALDRCEAIAFG